MRHTRFLQPVTLFVLAVFLVPMLGRSQERTKGGPSSRGSADTASVRRSLSKESEPKTPDRDVAVPIRAMTMFRAGVAHVLRETEIEGDENVTLHFDSDEINDLLKSLVAMDESGHVVAVTYGSQTPASELLKSFALDLRGNPSLSNLLQQLRGARVEVEAPHLIAGRIVSIEQQERKVKDEVQKVQVLNLRTQSGLKSLPLDQITNVQILDDKLASELDRALLAHAQALDTEQKRVTLQFQGKGTRRVLIGYLQKAPVWKMTYRLVLGQEKQHPAEQPKKSASGEESTDRQQSKDRKSSQLQGWAIVENTTDSNWKDVRLSLVSGQPISFVMPLYEPLFTNRPVVQLDVYSSLKPQTYEQSLRKDENRQMNAQAAAKAPALAEKAARQRAGIDRLASADAAADKSRRFLLRDSVLPRADAGEIGELFQYTVRGPVNLEQHRSSMIPVINSPLQTEKLSIYEESVHDKHPLRGVRVKNTTDLFFMEGPVTVYDEETYAGEAVLENVPTGKEALLTYAVDLAVEVAAEADMKPQSVVDVRFIKGALLVTKKQVRQQKYVVKNSAEELRTVLIVHPKRNGWKLITPADPAEVTRDSYRFRLELSGGESKQLEVQTEQTIEQRLALTNLPIQTIIQYRSAREIDEQTKQRLADLVQLKQDLENLTTDEKQIQDELAQITQQQDRIRKNMEQIDHNTDLYARYVKKLSQQEDRIEQLREQLDLLRQKIQEQRTKVDNFLLVE